MFYLIAGVVANVLIFLAFRTFPIYKIDNLQAIVVNYFVCVITGLILIDNLESLRAIDFTAAWSWVAVFIGLLLVLGFYVATHYSATDGCFHNLRCKQNVDGISHLIQLADTESRFQRIFNIQLPGHDPGGAVDLPGIAEKWY
jgi:hypothetical protein